MPYLTNHQEKQIIIIFLNKKFFIILKEMNTPTTRDFLRRPDGTRRRSSRQALAVIPVNNSVSPGTFLTFFIFYYLLFFVYFV